MAQFIPTQPPPQTQLTGGPYAAVNCTKAVTTLASHRHSVGRHRPGPDHLRALTHDTVGGETYEECTTAASLASGGEVILEPRYSQTRSNVRDYSAGGRGFGIGILGSVTVNTTRRTAPGFVGRHSVYVNAYHWLAASATVCTCEKLTKVAHAEFDVCDVGHSLAFLGFVRWSADLLYRAAEAHGGGGAGSPVISLLLTRDTEGVTRKSVETGAVHASTSNTSAVLASFAAGKAFFVKRTQTGASWLAPDGSSHHDWHQVANGTGVGYVMGRAIQ